MATRNLALALLFGSLSLSPVSSYHQCSSEEERSHPHLCSLLDLANDDSVSLAKEFKRCHFSAVIDDDFYSAGIQPRELINESNKVVGGGRSKSVPTVVAHGMGDSCFNDGMKSVTKAIGDRTNSYATCIPTGSNIAEDTVNGYLLDMDSSVDVFAEGVKADGELSGGFNAVGLSQGNALIRGYIQKYHGKEGYPLVKTFMSICGVNAGIGAFPNCDPHGGAMGTICRGLAEGLGSLAYNSFVQKNLFQANYYRDPTRTESPEYKKYSQLAQWNNEGDDIDHARNENFAKTESYVWIMATDDTIVWPKTGEIWEAMDPADPFHTLLPYNETKWFKEDTFGLAAADRAGKNHFESFEGQHIRFTKDELMGWVDKYF